MRVLIVGHRGFLGRRLTTWLAEQHNHEVIGASSRDGTGLDPNSGLPQASFAIPEKTDAVVYLAQSPFYRDVPKRAAHLLQVNAAAAVQVAEAARAAGVPRFLYASTGSVYAPSFFPLSEQSATRRDQWYPLSKIMAEDALALFANQLRLTIFRPFGIYGPTQTDMLVPRILESVRDGYDIALGGNSNVPADDGGLRISLCYVDDACAMIAGFLIQETPRVVNMAGSQAVSIRQLAETAGRILGREPKFVAAPKPRDTDLIADVTLLESLVGKPRYGLETGILRTLEAAA